MKTKILFVLALVWCFGLGLCFRSEDKIKVYTTHQARTPDHHIPAYMLEGTSAIGSRPRIITSGGGNGFTPGTTNVVGSKVSITGGLISPCTLETDIDTNFLYFSCPARFSGNVFINGTLGLQAIVSNSAYFSGDAPGPSGTSFYASAGGNFQSGPSQTLRLLSGQADGATSVAGYINTTSAWSTLGAHLFDFQNNSVMKAYIGQGGEIVTTSTKTKGTITLSAGTGTATVLAGAICTCVDSTTAALVKCAVVTTTLTATGTGTDVISYLCL